MGQVGGEPFAEPFVAHAPPVAAVEELVLEPAEEPLHGGVVRRASLGAHGVGQPVLLADADPSGPPVMHPRSLWITGRSPFPRVAIASSSMPSAMAASGLLDSRQETILPSKQSRPGTASTCSRPWRTGSRPSATACWDVRRGSPGSRGWRRPADLTPVRAPPLRFPQVYGPEPLLPHDAAHDLLRDDQRIRRVPPQHGVDGAVSPHAARPPRTGGAPVRARTAYLSTARMAVRP